MEIHADLSKGPGGDAAFEVLLSFWVPLLDAGLWEPLGSKLGVGAALGLVSWRFLEEHGVPFPFFFYLPFPEVSGS